MPPLQSGFAKDTAFLSAKAKSSRIRHSPNSGTVRRFPVLPTPCARTREFDEAEFSDCLPVSALVCVFAFDTGGLGLWLEAFGRSRFYRCQSTPGPPMPCFVAQSFAFAAFAIRFCQRHCVSLCKGKKLQNSAFAEFWDCTPVSCFTNVVCQNCKKLGFLRQFAGFRFGAFLAVQEWGWRTTRELDFSHSCDIPS